ncbi:hypothetical protein BU23DRAFT_335712 [Bimuria novae-zelandiae CBS 107.79]|uniref:Uncharacterized protein n=1 Tax=Bimuria novae-zelandiae CBS 107.79 TaxID=1447943 RepID=A0A6A5UL57_9PLEO|nr:hypothetical protein BU23DRAFT_335712 [Bimuria novae-zelandiae CBS 107.79]
MATNVSLKCAASEDPPALIETKPRKASSTIPTPELSTESPLKLTLTNPSRQQIPAAHKSNPSSLTRAPT